MTQLDIYATGETFDAIKQVDAEGNETWSARDLMPRLEYGADWRNFADVVSRAKAACKNSGHAAQDHFVDGTKMVRIGSGASRSVPDFTLTRYGAYLVAMNGDPRKPAVAAAQTYFAVQTHVAEVTAASGVLAALNLDLSTPEGRLRISEIIAEGARREIAIGIERDEARAELAIAAPKAEYVDGFVNADDASLVRVFAAQLGVGERALRRWMQDRKLVYRRTVGQRWSASKQQLVAEYEWLAYAGYRTWFKPVDQPNAPRLHNGQTATTLYVTPVGKVGIRRLLMKWPLDGEAA